jgi:hypothetical protein
MTGYTFNQLFDFTRTTSGTFVGSNGILQTTPASVNLLTFTQEFDNGAWSKNNASITANAAIAPDGTATADKLIEAATTSVHNAGQSITTAAVPYTFSCYIKAAERTFALLYHTQTNAAVSINLTTGATGTPTGISTPTASSVVALGNGWYRLSMTVTATAASNFFGIYPMTSLTGSISYAGDGTSGIFVWGAQLELGSTATTYARNNGGLFPPRFDYDPVTFAPRGILIEEQRVNLATYSNTFSDASWTAISVKDLIANSTVSPDGGVNASTLTDSSAVAFQGMGKTATVANDNATYTASIYVRKTTGGTSATFGVNLQLTGGTIVTAQPRLNTDTGTLINGTGTVQNAGAYWRLTTTVTNNTTGNTTLALAVYSATAAYNSGTDSAAATGSAIIYGAQLEAGAFATSYIPTVASQVTRTADVCTISAPMFAPWYNQPAGTFVAQFDYSGGTSADNPSGRFVTAASNATPNNLHAIYNRTSVAQSGLTSDGGVTQAAPGAGTSLGANAVASAAYAYSQNDFAFSYGGSAAATDASGTVPVNLTILGIGGSGYATPAFINGHIRRITYYPFRASNNQLQALST